MPEFTTNQWIVLALVLILGWFLGLFTLAGRRKWRQAYERERNARIAADAENARLTAQIAGLEGERDRRIELEREHETNRARATAANNRLRELEKHRPAIDSDTSGSIAAAASGKRDDLSLIFGVGRGGEIKLNALGIYRFTDIITLSLSEEAALEGRMDLSPGTIAEERWRDQAEMLRKGKYDDHARMFA